MAALPPQKTSVLVIGAGPGGSYASALLAREGVDVVTMDMDKFPRYHIGESMLPTMRFFLRFGGAEEAFDAAGFQKKYGATFKLSPKREAYSDFSIALGPGGYTWNVVRSEADKIIFDHAAKMGAKVFDGHKIDSIEFEPTTDDQWNGDLTGTKLVNPGRPVSAGWSRKDGTKGKISFDYLIDASGRAGIMSTKYLKNRRNNEGLKNIANWAYWKNTTPYAQGKKTEHSPFFEALSDASGWCWCIGLHNGTVSVGIVIRQDIFFGKKKAMGNPPAAELYKELLKLAPQICKLTEPGEIVSDCKQASDWSYSASGYAGPNFRMVGDAGCFIDPYFSSGVHLAMSGALSAATTIRASQRGDCTEYEASKWHTSKITEGYTRFLLVVMICLRQIRKPEENILSEREEEGYDDAFSQIQPVIQGTGDIRQTNEKMHSRVGGTVDYALDKFQKHEEKKTLTKEEEAHMISKLEDAPEDLERLSEDEIRILNDMTATTVHKVHGENDIKALTSDVYDGLTTRLEIGNLTLKRV